MVLERPAGRHQRKGYIAAPCLLDCHRRSSVMTIERQPIAVTAKVVLALLHLTADDRQARLHILSRSGHLMILAIRENTALGYCMIARFATNLGPTHCTVDLSAQTAYLKLQDLQGAFQPIRAFICSSAALVILYPESCKRQPAHLTHTP